MSSPPTTFGVSLSNLPITNVRREFDEYRELLQDPPFRASLSNMQKRVVELPLFTWRGLPHNFLTYMLQRSILGVEACASTAVAYELEARQKITPKIKGWLDEPNKVPGPRGTPQMFYNNLPALVDPDYKLEIRDPALWERVKPFYREIRNPLFHGYQLHAPTADAVIPLFDLLNDIYGWMDSWWRAFG
jgi:hypothetical protein